MNMRRRGSWITLGLLSVAGIAAAATIATRRRKSAKPRPTDGTREELYMQRRFGEMQPVALANCELARFGETHEGGYLRCGDLLGKVNAA